MEVQLEDDGGPNQGVDSGHDSTELIQDLSAPELKDLGC